jgi:hypothetical protein
MWIREKESLYFAALKKTLLVKKRIRGAKKIGMPVKLEAEEIDKSFTSNIRMVESYRTRRQHRCFRLAHDILSYNQRLQIFDKTDIKKVTKKKWRNRSNRTWQPLPLKNNLLQRF